MSDLPFVILHLNLFVELLIPMVRTELSGDSRIVPEIVKLRMIFHRTLV